MGAKKFVLISWTVQKLLQSEYTGGGGGGNLLPPPLPVTQV